MDIGGLEIFVRAEGPADGLPVVLLHGFPFDHGMWEPQRGTLERSYRTVCYDARGHGRSGVGDGQYTIDFLVDDLFGVMDGLGIGSAVLVGLSMGGYTVLRAVEREPERARALVLCDTRSGADTDEGRLGRVAAMRAIATGGPARFAEAFTPRVFAPGTVAARRPEVERIRSVVASSSPVGMRGTLLAMAARTDTTAGLAAIAVPTLVLVGEQDALTPPAEARAMASRIPGARCELVPAAGHLSNLENPEAFNRHLLAFLASLPA